MNASYAVIENGMVVNVIVWDGEDEFTVPDNLQLINISDISEQPGIGWAYSDGVFTAPPTPERSHDELVADAEQKKQSLIDAAMVNISVIQLKLQAGRKLTQEETTAAKAATAFELPADELSESLGKIAQLYKIPTRNIEQLGDALNYLDDKGHSQWTRLNTLAHRTA